jgi:hypothetical protein
MGLVLAAVLALADLTLSRAGLGIGLDPDGWEEPNLALVRGTLIVGLVLALTTIIAVVYTWLTANRIGARVIAGARVISVLLAVPIFFTEGMDEFGQVFGVPIVPFAAGHVLLTIPAVILVLSHPAAAPSPA